MSRAPNDERITSPLRILFVDDSQLDADLALRELARTGRAVVHERVDTEPLLRAALAHDTWDIVLCDWSMPALTAMRALEIVRAAPLDTPVIIVSGMVSEETAVEAMRAGARDYVPKGKLLRLTAAIERELREASERAGRREAEAAVAREQARFKALVESGKDGVAVATPDGVLLYVSPAALRIFGREGEHLEGTQVTDYFHPDERQEAQDRFAGASEAALGTTVTGPRRVVRPDGSVRMLEVTATNRITDPAVGGIVANFRDVTEARQTDARLALAQERFAKLFDAGIIGIALSDASGAVLDANDRFLEMLGYTREELAAGQLDWRRLTPPEWGAMNLETATELARDGRAVPREKEYFRKDGTRVPVLRGVARLDASTTVWVCSDLTEIKRAEKALLETRDQLRQSQKMDAIGQLAGGVAHDFNNLLSVILGFTDLAIADLAVEDPRREDLQMVLDAAHRATALTQQLLTFSRRQLVEPKVLELNELVTRATQMLRRLLGEDIELVTDLGPASHVRADPGGLDQVLLNLAVNARDAMPRGGRLVIRTSHTDVAPGAGVPGLAPGAYVTLAVSDTGVGMDDATQLRIFEPFFTTKAVGRGTGLGLATVFGVVSQSGGRISVQSALGRGATFSIVLPRVSSPAVVPIAPSNEAPRHHATILVVEDDDAVRRVVCGVLARDGHDVLDVGSGQAALALLRRDPREIDLLITDVVMPHMSGTELADIVAVERPDTKVLFMSGYTNDEMLRRGVREGQVALLQKPVGRDALLHKVREALLDREIGRATSHDRS